VKLSLLALLAGCGITDTGNPPAAPVIDRDLVDGRLSLGDPVLITGAANAISPASGVVRVTNLDGASDAVDGAVGADGSFEVVIDASLGDALRVQAIDVERSRPLDLEVGSFAETVHPLAHCLALEPAGVLVAERPREVVLVENGCDHEVTLSTAVRRERGVSISLASSTLEPGAITEASIAIEATATGEEVIFVAADIPMVDRRAITVVLR
jgi:hypothetical protein